ncbi:hypothetical protein ACWG0P_07190 [Amedibacillus sp. YH-ame6]
MKRLTKKCKDENGRFYAPNTDDVGEAMENVIFQKLGKLEDLEEQIGMPLEDFCTCMFHTGDFFYVIVKNEDTEQLEIVEVEKEEGYMNQYSQGAFYFTGESEKDIFYEYPISCYGKDLFLTYEEAEKKLEEMKNER